jgi:peptidylamidoglycolate lyase
MVSAVLVGASCASQAAPEQPAFMTPLASAPPVYERVPNWPRLPPGMEFGDMSAVDIDSHGHVFVFHRGEPDFDSASGGFVKAPTVVVLDQNTGTVVRSWGENTFVDPHGLTVDDRDNIWLTDTGLHQIFKFTHDGELLLKIGEARVGGWDANHFNRPTQVAVLPDGSFYVADGYVNSRVAKFDAQGKFLFEWGSFGEGPGQFRNPHGITIGPDGNLFVSDRENARLQIFDLEGRFIRQWLGAKSTGRVFSASVGPDRSVYLAIRPENRDALRTGVMRLTPQLEIVAQIGFRETGDAVFTSMHYVAVGSDGSVYTTETPDRRVSKYRPLR